MIQKGEEDGSVEYDGGDDNEKINDGESESVIVSHHI